MSFRRHNLGDATGDVIAVITKLHGIEQFDDVPSGAVQNRGGLVFKAHRLCLSLSSRLESNKEEEEEEEVQVRPSCSRGFVVDSRIHRSTNLPIRDSEKGAGILRNVEYFSEIPAESMQPFQSPRFDRSGMAGVCQWRFRFLIPTHPGTHSVRPNGPNT